LNGTKLGFPRIGSVANWRNRLVHADLFDDMLEAADYFSDMGNGPGLQARLSESHGRPASIEIVLPPLAMVVFKPRR